ncbi:MAG: fatty acid desaturase [Synechococcus lacustris]
MAVLNSRNDGPGWRQVLGHALFTLLAALAWANTSLPLPLRLLALVLYGAGLAFSFCAMHECGHRTAFASRRPNDWIAWWAGVLSFYNADFYRRFHQWHHRYTHQPGLDPELEQAPPASLAAYLLELTGLLWWLAKFRGHWSGLWGNFSGCPYISAELAPQISRSLRLQFLVYGLVLLLSFWGGNGFIFWYWLLPLALGQPILRFVLLAEHGGCSFDADGLRNTRTTLTLAPLRLLMWNMPFHGEHHLYPSIPFHALGRAHGWLGPHLEQLGKGYLRVNAAFLRQPSLGAMPGQG